MKNQYNLKMLIDALEGIENKGLSVVYDFGGLIPTTFDSWRGIYAELALGWTAQEWDESIDGYPEMTVGALLHLANDANGRTFTGYKGGEFAMGLLTPIWIDNWGEYTSTALVGVEVSYHVVLVTERAWP